MASALLDDTPVARHSNGNGEKYCTTSPASIMSHADTKFTPEKELEGGDMKRLSRSYTMSPSYEAKLVTLHSDDSDGSSLSENFQTPEIPRKSSKRNIRKVHGTSPHAGSDIATGGLTKSRTVKINTPNRHRTTFSGTPTSYSTQQLRSKLSKSPSHTTADAEEINHKVASVIAATAALKDTANISAEQAPSLMMRLKSTKAFTKFSRALSGHFHGNPDKKIRQGNLSNETYSLSAERQDTTSSRSQSTTFETLLLPTPKSPTSSLGRRLNEGRNLNGDKIRDLTGGTYQRKPLHSDGKSLRNGNSLDDPFSESRTSDRSLTFFESRLKDQALQNSGMNAKMEGNPFETEHLFDRGIDDPLRSPPFASSTPRYRIDPTSNGKVHLEKSRAGLAQAVISSNRTSSSPQVQVGKPTKIPVSNHTASLDSLAQRPDETG